MRGPNLRLVPCIDHNLLEALNLEPVIFKFEGCLPRHTVLAGKEDGAVIGGTRRQCTKSKVWKRSFPFRVTENSVQPDQGRILPLIGPSIFPVLQRYLNQLTVIKRSSELSMSLLFKLRLFLSLA